jgi:hypothetical protein
MAQVNWKKIEHIVLCIFGVICLAILLVYAGAFGVIPTW